MERIGEFLNSPLYAEISMWGTLLVLAIAAWYAIPERVRVGLLRAGRFALYLLEWLGWCGLWLFRVIANLIRDVVWGNPQAATAGAGAGEMDAPVSRVWVRLPAAYVAAHPHPHPLEGQTAPASVCLSEPEEPAEPPLPPAVTRLTVDRSREALLEALLALDWQPSQIRAVVKADNNKFAGEIEAARARLQAPATAPRQTPVAGRELADDVTFRAPPTA